MAGWEDMTVADLEAMGISLDEFEQMLNDGQDPFSTDYESMGVLSPMDISPQATQWDVLDAQKTTRAAYGPPTGHQRRQDRSFMMPDSGAFPYDAVTQANPYLRELINTAISGAKPGPNQAFDVEQYVFGKIANEEDALEGGYDPEGDVGKTRIGKAVSQVLGKEGEFDYIADQFHADDRRWATKDRGKQRRLLQEWLQNEAGATLEGAAPSVARNVNFSDWATQRQTGEPFAFEGEGFDRAGSFEGGRGGAPRVQLDERYWGPNQTEGQAAQMSLTDFKRAYADTLAAEIGERPQVGQRIEDPSGGHWVINVNTRKKSPLESQRQANERYNARQSRNRERSDRNSTRGGRSFGDRFKDTWNRLSLGR